MHPHGRAAGGLGGDDLGVPPVHPDVRVPPLTAELRLGDDVVIEGPQRGVAEALVVVGDLFFRQAHADQVHPVRVERLRRVARRAGPAHPGSAGGAHHRFERGHQAAGAGPPLGFAVRSLGPVHRPPAGRNHEVVLAVCLRGVILPVAWAHPVPGEAGVGQGGRSLRTSSSPGRAREQAYPVRQRRYCPPLTVLLYPLTKGGVPVRTRIALIRSGTAVHSGSGATRRRGPRGSGRRGLRASGSLLAAVTGCPAAGQQVEQHGEAG